MVKFIRQVVENQLATAQDIWNRAVESLKLSNAKQRHEIINDTLITVSQMGEREFARDLIKESGLEDSVFPLTRALDYLLTSDESLIEKLSPEIRNIVEEIVKKLQPIAKASTKSGSKKKTRKTKSTPRRSTAKRLR
ncbi:MAG: hypothetical protein ACJ741_05495 [Pyrinomonadaceae bacterium]